LAVGFAATAAGFATGAVGFPDCVCAHATVAHTITAIKAHGILLITNALILTGNRGAGLAGESACPTAA
jgi:hypothetical protein